MTVGGVSATLIGAQLVSSDPCELWQAAVPTGTTGDIVVTMSAGMLNLGIAVWRVVGAAAAVTEMLTSTADPMNVAIDCPANGVIIAIAGNHFSGATFTWTNLTERFDAPTEDSNGDYYTGASDNFASTQTNLSITCTQTTSGTRNHMVACSFGPA